MDKITTTALALSVTSYLKDDLYANYEGIYLGDKPITATCGKVYGGEQVLIINKGDKVKISTECIMSELPLKEINCSGIAFIYADNPSRGGVIVITKLLSDS